MATLRYGTESVLWNSSTLLHYKHRTWKYGADAIKTTQENSRKFNNVKCYFSGTKKLMYVIIVLLRLKTGSLQVYFIVLFACMIPYVQYFLVVFNRFFHCLLHCQNPNSSYYDTAWSRSLHWMFPIVIRSILCNRRCDFQLHFLVVWDYS